MGGFIPLAMFQLLNLVHLLHMRANAELYALLVFLAFN